MNLTILFISVSVLVFVVSWIIFDLWIMKKEGKGESISAHIIRGSKKYPVMVFGFTAPVFFLLGHLLWSMKTVDYKSKENFAKECKEFLSDIKTQ